MAVAAAEMAFAGELGMELFLKEVPIDRSKIKRNDSILFSESNSRFIVEVKKEHRRDFEGILKGIPCGLVGCVSQNKEFKVNGMDGKICINADIAGLKEAWQKTLRW